ncbi:isochorismatase family cysteine hydrolase [Variovorax sp. J31P207]|uniref:isochorismatase family protein n=1 Tax=Variovorax sp. J31P207 TaxID=3053510 RepID=UPI0025777D19|nr:isochorismatase family cysteine hydrolase [Variovorax sp. J31P207]MDM0071513.1 isochorismatase family cysteine hydrolase [Variovorax sp. J31P207]
MRTAHLVVDLQQGYCGVGEPLEVPRARDVVGPVNRISDALRRAGGLNVYTRNTFVPGDEEEWSFYYRHFGHAMDVTKMIKGAPAQALWPELTVDESADWVIDKQRYSAFVPNTCELDQRLKVRGIDTLIITGTVTNCCCESTARDAMQRNYKVFFVSDGTAALSDEEQHATLNNMQWLFADVVTTDEMVRLIDQAAP